MAPLRMTDDEAHEAMDEWDPLTHISLVEPALLKGQLHHPAVQFSDLWRDPDIHSARNNAWQLREPMEAMRLMSCCRGFDPEENPGFWREYFLGRGVTSTHRITRDLFNGFHVVWNKEVDPESVAAAFWTLLSPSTKPKGLDLTTQQWIEERIEEYIERPPPPLEVSLCVRGVSIDWSAIKQVMDHLSRMAIAESNGSPPKKVRLVVGTNEERKYWGCSSGLVDLLAMPNVDLVELHIRSDDNQIPTALNYLTRQLARVDVVRVLSWEFECDPHGVGAIFSALPSMASLSSLTLVCSHDPRDRGYCGPKGQKIPCRFWPWFAYALTQRKLRGLPLDLGFNPGFRAKEEIEAACQQMNCLAQLVSGVLKTEDELILQDHGVTAELALGTIVAPMEDKIGSVGLTIYPAQRVNVIAKYGENAVVVVPGAGLMTTQLKALRAWEDNTSGLTSGSSDRFLVDSVVCNRSSPAYVSSILEVLGSSITHLGIRPHSRVKPATLEKILSMCPKLTKLALKDADVDSFQPLVEAYSERENRIATLIFERSEQHEASKSLAGFMLRYIAAQQTREHPMAEIIRELCFERVLLRANLVRKLAVALSENRTVDFLRVCVKPSNEADKLKRGRLLKNVMDQPLRQSECSRNALYTFLSVARRTHILRELPVPCVEMVAQYAATPVLRHFSWT